jgi:hypothetical protein
MSLINHGLVFAEPELRACSRTSAPGWALKAAALCALFAHMFATSNCVVVWYCLSNGRCIMGRSCHIRFRLVL